MVIINHNIAIPGNSLSKHNKLLVYETRASVIFKSVGKNLILLDKNIGDILSGL